MNIKEFAQNVYEDINDLAETNNTDFITEIARRYLERMEDCDEVSAPDLCIFSSPRAKITAYDYNEEAETLDLFLFIHTTPMASRADSKIKSGFNYLRNFYDQCLKRKSSFDGNESSFSSEIQEAISMIRESKNNVNAVRFYILTDGVVASPDEINTYLGHCTHLSSRPDKSRQ